MIHLRDKGILAFSIPYIEKTLLDTLRSLKEQYITDNSDLEDGNEIMLINRYVCYPMSLPPSIRVMYYRTIEFVRVNFHDHDVCLNHHNVRVKITKYPSGYLKIWDKESTKGQFAVVFTIEDGRSSTGRGPKIESRINPKFNNGLDTEILSSVGDRVFFIKNLASDYFQFQETCSSFVNCKYKIEFIFDKKQETKNKITKTPIKQQLKKNR